MNLFLDKAKFIADNTCSIQDLHIYLYISLAIS